VGNFHRSTLKGNFLSFKIFFQMQLCKRSRKIPGVTAFLTRKKSSAKSSVGKHCKILRHQKARRIYVDFCAKCKKMAQMQHWND